MRKSYFILLILSIFTSNAFSQAVCPIKTLKVNKVNGKILLGVKSKIPYSNAGIFLFKLDDVETIVSTTTTNEEGYFEFDNIKKGKYGFKFDVIFDGMLYRPYRAIVKVKKTDSSKLKPSILIIYSGDCWDTEAETVK